MKPMLHDSIIPLIVALLCGQLAAETNARFKRFDQNSDGTTSAEELRPPRIFRAADKNGAGFRSAEECAAAQQKRASIPAPAVNSNAPYLQSSQTLTVDGRERSFIVQVPKSQTSKLPVVVVFHGGGGRGENMLVKANFGPLMIRESFIAVYPSGWKGHWNDGRNAPRIASQQEGVDDVKFVRAIVDHFAKQYPIDRSRLFAAGGSNGGIFCHYLDATAADLFAAIAPIIGGLAEPVAADFKPSHPISLLVIQGDADPLVPIGGGAISNQDRGGRIIATEAMLKLYLARNSITGKPAEELLPDTDPADGCRTHVRRYPPGEGGVKVEYWRIQGGGHTLPGRGNPAPRMAEGLVGKTCRDFDFREVVWDFFKSCRPRIVNGE